MSTAPSGTSPSSRPHLVARAEDRVNGIVTRVLRRRGWVGRVEPSTGYGTTSWVRVLGRALLAPPGTSAGQATERDPASARRAVRGWRSFLTAQVPHASVEVRVGDVTTTVRADRGGYIDTVLEVELEPGWHQATFTLDGQRATSAVRVIGPEQTVAMLSDVDDTVMVTALPRPLLAAWNAMVLHEDARRPVPGMAQLYARWQRANPDAPTFYLSTGAWNVAPALRRFLERHRYPAGPFLLTDWGPTNTGWFRSGPEHKIESLRRLMDELPHVRWVLVGDDGQHDPQLYAQIAEEFPGRVELVLIRQLSVAQQVLAHGAPLPAEKERRATEKPEGPRTVLGPDGNALALRLIDAGLLPPRKR
ncbi:MAG: DUF2183 domain-containing protein [Actinomycetales bacterium]|nr:DUF2183 domain-containing protein [Actinomycetales bacterium]